MKNGEVMKEGPSINSRGGNLAVHRTQRRPSDIGKVVEESVLRLNAPDNIAINISLNLADPMVWIDRALVLETLVNLGKGSSTIDALMIEHASTPDEFELLANKLAEYYPREKTLRSFYSPVSGAHCGPHVLCVDYIEGK